MAAADGWHELAVANPTFLLERLGSECTDLQGLRELTVNGLDAIAALGADRPRPGGVGSGLGAVRRLRRPGAQAVGDRHRHRDDRRAAAPLHQPAGGERPRAIADRQLRRRRKGGRRLAQPARARVPLLASGRRLAGVLQAPPGRAVGTRAPAVGGRPRRLLAAAGRRGEAVASARPGSRHPGRAARRARAARHHAGAAERHRRPTALDHPLPQRPLPALPVAGRGPRARTPRPRRRTHRDGSTASSTTSSTTPSRQEPWS